MEKVVAEAIKDGSDGPVLANPASVEAPNFRWVVIKSGLLDGEEIVVVLKADDVKEAERMEPGRVVYLLAEMQELVRYPRDPESLKRIHMIKKKFDGVIVPAHSRLGQRLRWEGLWE